jgi:hypothetical protein
MYHACIKNKLFQLSAHIASRELSAATVSVMQTPDDIKYWSIAKFTRSLAAASSRAIISGEDEFLVYFIAVISLKHSFRNDLRLFSYTCLKI